MDSAQLALTPMERIIARNMAAQTASKASVVGSQFLIQSKRMGFVWR
jgi:hypothetical protein